MTPYRAQQFEILVHLTSLRQATRMRRADGCLWCDLRALQRSPPSQRKSPLLGRGLLGLDQGGPNGRDLLSSVDFNDDRLINRLINRSVFLLHIKRIEQRCSRLCIGEKALAMFE